MFFFYRNLIKFLFPLLILIIYLRKFLKKEDPTRYKEKILKFNQVKNKEELIWFHGSSIGEVLSIIPIIQHYIKQKNKLKILISSSTLSSGEIIKEKFKKNNNIIHCYFPLDLPHLAESFLNTWNPSLIGFIDSEIWPNFLWEIKKKKIPLVLINARITNKTFKRWNLFSKFSKRIFSSFDLCIASSKDSADKLYKLNANNIKLFGNLKYISTQKINDKLDSYNFNLLKQKKVWCAASTHSGEEIFCLNAHKIIKKDHNNLLTIIIPRHINRIQSVYSECKKHNLNAQILNKTDKIRNDVDIILVNAFGELPKYYNYCKSIFMGKSLLKKLNLVGGQNPIEPAKYDCKIYYGPYVYNFLEVYEYLKKNNMAFQIKDVQDLSANISRDLNNLKKINLENIKKINSFGEKILSNTIKELDAIF